MKESMENRKIEIKIDSSYYTISVATCLSIKCCRGNYIGMRQELVLFFYGKIRSNKPLGSFQIVIEVAKCLNIKCYISGNMKSYRMQQSCF